MADSNITVADLAATSAVGQIKLSWTFDDPNAEGLPYLALDAVEVWAAVANDRSTATKVGEGLFDFVHTGVPQESIRHYWIKPRNRSGLYGDWFPSGSTDGLHANSLGDGYTLVNGDIAASVASNELTVALKSFDGDDPSADKPITITFFNDDGSTTTAIIDEALSLVISNGSTLQTDNVSAFRLWVVALLVGSDVQIGVINCRFTTGNYCDIYPINDRVAVYWRAEGGAGAADSAGEIVTDDTWSSGTRPMRIIGYLTWESPLATAGVWTDPPDVVRKHRAGMPLPGDEISRNQHQTAGSSTYAPSAAFGFDDTVPTYAERAFWTSLTITPESAANTLEVNFSANLSPDAANEYVALLIGLPTSGDAFVSRIKRSEGADIPMPLDLQYFTPANSNVQMNYDFGFGYTKSSGTLTLNGSAGARKLHGTLVSSCSIIERMS